MHEHYINDEEVQEYIYMQLLKRGFHASQKETEALTDIFWDYLIDIGVIVEDEG